MHLFSSSGQKLGFFAAPANLPYLRQSQTSLAQALTQTRCHITTFRCDFPAGKPSFNFFPVQRLDMMATGGGWSVLESGGRGWRLRGKSPCAEQCSGRGARVFFSCADRRLDRRGQQLSIDSTLASLQVWWSGFFCMSTEGVSAQSALSGVELTERKQGTDGGQC